MRGIGGVCLLFVVCLLLGSCGFGRPGTAQAVNVETKANGQIDGEGTRLKTKDFEVTVPPGYDAKINTAAAVQPTPPDESATAKVKDAQSDSGKAGKTPAAFGLGGTMWIGIGLIILGLLVFLFKQRGLKILGSVGPTGPIMAAVAVLPKGFGIGLMILGGVIIILPWLLDSVQPLVIPTAGAAVAILLIWWIYNIYSDEKRQAALAEATGKYNRPTPAPPLTGDPYDDEPTHFQNALTDKAQRGAT